MSELILKRTDHGNFRRQLLTNASILALLGYAWTPSATLAASDEGRPTVWIELGGQLERVDTPQALFAPAFFDLANPAVLGTIADAQRPSRYSIGGEGKIAFIPRGGDWVFSAALRYGRVGNARHLHYETPGLPTVFGTFNNAVTVNKPNRRNFGDGQTDSKESHFVFDFHTGKDVGLGLFGDGGISVISAGVRYAQFTSGADATIHARPIYGFGPAVRKKVSGKYQSNRPSYRQTYTAVVHTQRNTHAIGPSVSWDASAPLVGHEESMTVAFDWGMNAAFLFGRQRTHVDHQTSGHYNHAEKVPAQVRNYVQSAAHDRSKSIVVPNVGGFAGISLKFPNAKVSLGYRADFFFNATDSGIDARDAANTNFYGPFATISIGLGG